MLSHLGCITLQAGDGEEAINLYKSSLEKNEPINAVIMDMTIPGGMGGKEAVSEILKLDANAKVIVSNGYCQRSHNGQSQRIRVLLRHYQTLPAGRACKIH